MARSINEIKKQITDQFIENSFIKNLYKLKSGKTFEDQFSKVSIENFLCFITASAIWILEKLFSTHEQEIKRILDSQEVHTGKWYAEKVKNFLYGVNLPPETDIYDTSQLTPEEIKRVRIILYGENLPPETDIPLPLTPEEIEKIKIISHVAVTEVGNEVRIKVAKTVIEKEKEVVTRLSEDERYELITYVNQIKDAGVRCRITSQNADKLTLNLKVYVDPVVFNSEGKVGYEDPIRDMIYDYLKRLPFNGTLVLAHLLDEIQTIKGVVYPHIVSASAKYGQIETPLKLQGNNPDTSCKEIYQPDSGYIEIEKLTVTTTPHNSLL